MRHTHGLTALSLSFLIMMLCAMLAPAFAKEALQYRPDSSTARAFNAAHAVWLTASPGDNRSNLGELLRHLNRAKAQNKAPLIVTYFIPNRDLGQASQGGLSGEGAYIAEHEKLLRELLKFKAESGLTPTVILEPDALAQAWEHLKAAPDELGRRGLFLERLVLLRAAVMLYHEAGIPVYLDAAHSGWFPNAEAIHNLTDILLAAGAESATGFTSNVSNRQWFDAKSSGFQKKWYRFWEADPYTPPAQTERAYAAEILRVLEMKQARETEGGAGEKKASEWQWLADISRSGGNPQPRPYTLRPDGSIETPIDGKATTIGKWYTEDDGQRWLYPYRGPSIPLEKLVKEQAYTWDAETSILTAPLWLDPVGELRNAIHAKDAQAQAGRIRGLHIKPADEADGALGFPPGMSKRHLNGAYSKL